MVNGPRRVGPQGVLAARTAGQRVVVEQGGRRVPAPAPVEDQAIVFAGDRIRVSTPAAAATAIRASATAAVEPDVLRGYYTREEGSDASAPAARMSRDASVSPGAP